MVATPRLRPTGVHNLNTVSLVATAGRVFPGHKVSLALQDFLSLVWWLRALLQAQISEEISDPVMPAHPVCCRLVCAGAVTVKGDDV